MKFPELDRLFLILGGALLATFAAGCNASRTQATGDPCPCPNAAAPGYVPAVSSPGTTYGTGVSRGQPRPAPVSQYDGTPNSARRPYRPFPPNDEVEVDTGGVPPELPAEGENEANAAGTQSGFATLQKKMADRWRKSSLNRKNRVGSTPAPATATIPPQRNAAPGSNPVARTGGNLARSNRTVGGGSSRSMTPDQRLVTLSPPSDVDQSSGEPRRPLPLTPDDRQFAATAQASSAATIPLRSPALQPVTAETRLQTSYAAVESTDQPPAWPDRPTGPVARQNVTSSVALPASLNRLPEATDPGREPIRLIDPPRLRTPPIDGSLETRSDADRGLAVSRILVCRQVRGFEDVVQLDPRRLRRGQPLLIYATLENFRSMATSKGYRTLTLSTLEIRKPDGELVQRQPLGTAVDLVEVPRRDFFLTHLVTIPDDLPAGDYLFDLYVDDLLKHESANAQIAVHVTEDRSPRDGTADISKFATRPAGNPR